MLTNKDGRAIPVRQSVTVIKDGVKKESLIGYLFIVNDITEYKKVERMKQEFIAAVSHELRTPLTAIRGSVSLVTNVMAQEISSRVKALLDVANKNCEQMIALVNDILDMQKIESGMFSFNFEVMPLPFLLHHALEVNQLYADQFRVKFELNQAIPEVRLRVDEGRFIQVMTNLLSNAAKFSPANSKVDIVSEQIGNMVRISVSNCGLGIPESFRMSVFEKFTQVDSSTARKKEGTGLGLAITRTLVESMHGKIGFDSQPDILTTFYVEFPLWKELDELTEPGSVELWNDSSSKRI